MDGNIVLSGYSLVGKGCLRKSNRAQILIVCSGMRDGSKVQAPVPLTYLRTKKSQLRQSLEAEWQSITAHTRAYPVRYMVHNIANAMWEGHAFNDAPQVREVRDTTTKGMMLSACLVGSNTSSQAFEGRELHRKKPQQKPIKRSRMNFLPSISIPKP
jgi:hypothetical protein